MSNVTTVGIGLAQNVFQVHGVDSRGKPVVRKQLRRRQMAEFFANLPSSLVGMEACARAHYWARKQASLGHTVKLMAPQFVKPYVKTNKHDVADAEAICEAVSRPTMRFVAVKTPEQQSVLALHCARQGFVKARTAQGNQIRGLLGEFGIAIPQGLSFGDRHLPRSGAHSAARGRIIPVKQGLTPYPATGLQSYARISKGFAMDYSIGQLAHAAGIGIETIRYYERRGLMPEPPRAASGYRRYPEYAAGRLRFIRRAKRLGFTLDEIETLLSLQAGGERAEVKAIAEAKLAEIETRLADLERMRDTLRDVTRRCSGRGPVDGCPIIETLSEQTGATDTPIYEDTNHG